MKNQIIKFFALLIVSFAGFSCEKEYGDDTLGPLEDSKAAIPVTVTNQEYFERYPIVTASISSGGNFSVTFQIPADKGKIKEITRITTGSSGLVNVQSSVASLSYIPAPIAGNGTNEITFSSNLAMYTTYRTRVGPLLGSGATGLTLAGPAATVSATPTSPTQIRFFFLLTLEDGTTIIPTEVRVRVVS